MGGAVDHRDDRDTRLWALFAQNAAILSDTSAAQADRHAAAHVLHAALADACGVADLAAPRDDADSFIETNLAEGLAIAPIDAAQCLTSYVRSYAFAEGLRRAIVAAQARWPGERIKVLYAGTGPLAPLALLQTVQFDASEVGFTCLDIHPFSTKASRGLFHKLGCSAYVDAWITADAACWVPPDGGDFHVIVTEVMQRALRKEPQVAVTRHLTRFLRPGGDIVPKRIALDLRLFDPAELMAAVLDCSDMTRSLTCGHSLGIAFELTAQTAHKTAGQETSIRMPDLVVPANLPRPMSLMIATLIEVSAGIFIDENANGLTTYEILNHLPQMRGGETLHIDFRLGMCPELLVNVREGTA